MKAQLGLVCAICPEPDLLLLDEPTSGLDPIVRREFLQTVIGAYQDSGDRARTVFVSTHLIGEWEGLIDEFMIVDEGRELLTLDADAARERTKKLRLRFAATPPQIREPGLVEVSRDGRELVLLTSDYSDALAARLQSANPESLSVENLTLEEIFIATAQKKERKA
jgi:ABC-2 type transport system ATP-binding protein